jgi:hypothetical protein
MEQNRSLSFDLTPDYVDPALAAAARVKVAETLFLAMPIGDASDEATAEFMEAEARWDVADDAFADAVPSSPEGALAKLRAVLDMQRAMMLSERNLEVRHIRALMTYTERLIALRRG